MCLFAILILMISTTFVEASCFLRCLRSKRQSNHDAGTAPVHPILETSAFSGDLEQSPVPMGNEENLGLIFSDFGSDGVIQNALNGVIQRRLSNKPEQGGPIMNIIEQMIPMLDQDSTSSQWDSADGVRMVPMTMGDEDDHCLIFSDDEANSDDPLVTGMTIFFEGTINGAVDMNSEGTVEDLVTAVGAVIGGPTALSFADKRLGNMHAALSDLGICPESVVRTVPMNIIKVRLQLIQLERPVIEGGLSKPSPRYGLNEGVLDLYDVPRQELMFEVPYPGDLCPVSRFVDYLRDSLILKIHRGHWDRVLKARTGYSWFHRNSFQQFIHNLDNDGEKDLIDIFPLPDYEVWEMERDHYKHNFAQRHLKYLQQQRVAIEWEQLMEMSSRYHRDSLVRGKHTIRVFYKVLD